VFGSRALPGRAGGAIVLPRLPIRYKGEGRERRGRKGFGIGRGGKGRT